ncbi:Chaperone SurA precursor [Falsiruegeria litorea R37]|uniref:Parvulin-like PPIase n=1 Tax=Falsiruegeria litorea R37 TaxID=1200284 RepID=A0A1Y5SMB2_9RHOB|nr:peptidylprolyl isomerase [Falsiruegeria litorea]SLN43460.1 Chaperone SurA precursor [Falsiruegeria litorea R37]
MQKILTPLMGPLSRVLRQWSKPVGLLATVGMLGLAPVQATSQSLFAPAIRVNQEVITRFELEQRELFLQILRFPGNPAEVARKGLIEDRLRQQVMKEAGLDIPPEDVQQGIDQFASQGNLSPEEFIQALGQAGVSEETVRDFITVQLAWRDYVSARFLSRARPTEAEIDRALGRGGGGGIQVLLSEVIIPVTPQTVDQVDEVAQQIASLKTYDDFSAAATQFSASDTRNNGGRMNWLSVSSLPPALQPIILGLNPGEITDPIALPNAVALFQMRGIQEIATGAPRYSSIEYATYFLSGGRTPETLATAGQIARYVDSCDDLYGVAKGQPESVLDRVTAKPSEIPQDIALELAKLDPGETSSALTRNNGQTLVFLMLCNRTADLAQDASREEVANALTQQRLQSFAESLLAQLKADAIIEE